MSKRNTNPKATWMRPMRTPRYNAMTAVIRRKGEKIDAGNFSIPQGYTLDDYPGGPEAARAKMLTACSRKMRVGDTVTVERMEYTPAKTPIERVPDSEWTIQYINGYGRSWKQLS